MMRYLAIGGLVLAVGGAAAAEAPSAESIAAGKTVYGRCAACHLANGAGVPGAFPPLAGRVARIAQEEQGRAYLAATIQGGLMGRIEVEGTPYMGVMPAQSGMTPEQIANVLNYTMTLEPAGAEPSDTKARAFTADEIATILAAETKWTPQAAHAMRDDALAAVAAAAENADALEEQATE